MKRARLAAVAAFAVAIASLSPAAQAADPIKWRVQTALPAASMYMDILKDFGRNVDEMSGGRLQTEMLPVGAVVGFFEVMDAVDKGIVEGGFTWAHFFSESAPPPTSSPISLRSAAWISSPTSPGSMKAVATSSTRISSTTTSRRTWSPSSI